MIRWWICVNNQQFVKIAAAVEEWERSSRMRSSSDHFGHFEHFLGSEGWREIDTEGWLRGEQQTWEGCSGIFIDKFKFASSSSSLWWLKLTTVVIIAM